MSYVYTSIVLTLAMASAGAANAQEWKHRIHTDDFTDEQVNVASVKIDAGDHQFDLFVNCRDETLNVGLTGTYINPTGGRRKTT